MAPDDMILLTALNVETLNAEKAIFVSVLRGNTCPSLSTVLRARVRICTVRQSVLMETSTVAVNPYCCTANLVDKNAAPPT